MQLSLSSSSAAAEAPRTPLASRRHNVAHSLPQSPRPTGADDEGDKTPRARPVRLPPPPPPPTPVAPDSPASPSTETVRRRRQRAMDAPLFFSPPSMPLAASSLTPEAFYAERALLSALDAVTSAALELRACKEPGDSTAGRQRLRQAILQIRASGRRAHHERLKTRPWCQLPGHVEPLTLGRMAALAAEQLFVCDDDGVASSAIIVEPSTLDMLRRSHALMSMPARTRQSLYRHSDAGVRARMMQLWVGVVLRNAPEVFSDEQIGLTEAEREQQRRRWCQRYSTGAVCAGHIVPPREACGAAAYAADVAEPQEGRRRPRAERAARPAPVRSFFNVPFERALAWLDDASFGQPAQPF